MKCLICLAALFSAGVYAGEYQYKEHGHVIKLYSIDGHVKSRLKKSGKKMEVFSLSPDGRRPHRALPGGVVVRLKEEARLNSGEEVSAWAKANGLVVDKKMNAPRTWLFKSPEGVETLAVSDKIGTLPEVESVEPNWWIDVENRKPHLDKRKFGERPANQLSADPL